MHGTMNVMDRTGHTTIKWDPTVSAEVTMARDTFNSLTGQGYQAFRSGPGGERSERLRTFDPQATTMILVPHLQGG